ncbi:uncharacterized protein LOC107044269 [Diachasma alloeum]|uniref:uncharacterized protein LOC107044269 n=1 Tax=Diachasma alloeum TaxID=454923 RepID=UPI0007383714|nr:uncharacterized protein LOC107044269 [Diachasma alloeum]
MSNKSTKDKFPNNPSSLGVGGKRRKIDSPSQNSSTKKSTLRALNSEVDEALMELLSGCNLPFSVVESKFFKRFANLLNPSYKIPSRKKVATKLLDELYGKMSKQLECSVETDGVLLIDGWKNSSANTKNVVCTIYTSDKRSYFLHSWDFTELSETGDASADVIDEAAIMAKEKFNINIYAVVSDNASSMMRMGRLVNIWHTTCHSHSAN